ncbi:MAG: 3-oxoacyl-ACP reductase FabG [Deltaproteobacteria bacterium]|nr:3-oxoacyl-ACP reductase FabG [Deltaproteobacteria bacterium]
MRLQGKVAIVTGGGHGIGRQYCLSFVREGAKVVVAEVDARAAQRVADEIKSGGGEAIAVPTDVASEASTKEMARRAIEAFGRIDVLVNNAAIFATIPISRVGIEELSIEEWDRVMVVNVKGVFLCCRAVLPQMKRQGKGKIINIASGTIYHGGGGRIHYVASKAAVVGFTRTLAREVGDYNITVNAISPGSTLSEENPTPEIIKMREEATGSRCIKRVQTPQDLQGAMVFLASDESDFITGQTLVVDGGNAMP